MPLQRWLAAGAIAAAALAGTYAQADLFGRFLDRSDQVENAGRDAADREAYSFAVADAGEIGKIVTPVSFQTLPAPGGEGVLVPIPEPAPAGPTPVPAYYPPTPAEGVPLPGVPVEGYLSGGPVPPIGLGLPVEGYPLYHRVEYEDLDHIHPCATPTVVQVLDPCTDDDHGCLFGHRRHRHDCDACQTCGPRCVFVKICVPPGCPKVKVSRDGRKVKYDYGDYKVEIESEDGVVSVDYDD